MKHAKKGLCLTVVLSAACSWTLAAAPGGQQNAEGLRGEIANVEGDTVMLNRGSEDGLREGLQIACLKQTGQGDQAVHPATGEIYCSRITVLAKLKVTAAQEGLAFAKIAESAPGSRAPKAGDAFVVDGKGDYKLGTAWVRSKPAILVADDFSKAVDPKTWQIVYKPFAVEGGVLQLGYNGYVHAVHPPASSVEVDLDAWSDAARPGLLWGVEAGKAQVRFRAACQWGKVMVTRLDVKPEGEETAWLKSDKPIDYVKGKKIHHKMIIGQKRAQHFMDGHLVNEILLDKALPPITAFFASDDCTGSSYYDNVRITGMRCSTSAVLKGPMPSGSRYVLFADDKEAVVDYGADKVKPGTKLVAAHIKKVVDHPETKKHYSIQYEKSGEIEVTAADERMCQTKVVTNDGISYGDRVFVIQAEAKPFEKTWWERWPE